MQEEEHHKRNRLAENTGTAVTVAAALEIVQSNASRSESLWSRVGGFFMNVLIGLGTLTVFDAVVDSFRGKKKRPHQNGTPQQDANTAEPASFEQATRTSWAKDIAEEKSCGCPYRRS